MPQSVRIQPFEQTEINPLSPLERAIPSSQFESNQLSLSPHRMTNNGQVTGPVRGSTFTSRNKTVFAGNSFRNGTGGIVAGGTTHRNDWLNLGKDHRAETEVPGSRTMGNFMEIEKVKVTGRNNRVTTEVNDTASVELS